MSIIEIMQKLNEKKIFPYVEFGKLKQNQKIGHWIEILSN